MATPGLTFEHGAAFAIMDRNLQAPTEHAFDYGSCAATQHHHNQLLAARQPMGGGYPGALNEPCDQAMRIDLNMTMRMAPCLNVGAARVGVPAAVNALADYAPFPQAINPGVYLPTQPFRRPQQFSYQQLPTHSVQTPFYAAAPCRYDSGAYMAGAGVVASEGGLVQLVASAPPLVQPTGTEARARLRANQLGHQCPICQKQYCRRSTLKAHLRQHSGERPYMCPICGKTFSQAANLTAHRRVHTGEKPFSCQICLRPFSQSSSLVTHKRTHTGERPYPCPHCHKAFTDSSTLTKHLRTHTGQKPYECSTCLMRFTQSGNLHRHMKTHRDVV